MGDTKIKLPPLPVPSKMFTSMQDLFPRKHDLRVSREELAPKEGYGHWTAKIKVPA